jgi:DNA-binding transcriptional MerR regulator
MTGTERLLTIGEFAKLTHLPIKTLHHYHDVEVLVPAEVDAQSGYRRYSFDQVAAAQLVRRLRSLDMPLPEVRQALAAPDEAARNQTILTYLARVDHELTQAQLAVRSLRALLEQQSYPIEIEHRRLDAMPAVAIEASVERPALEAWCARTYPLLDAAVAAAGAEPAGPGGGLYSDEFFELATGRVVAFVPTTTPLEATDSVGRLPGEAKPFVVPAATAAVAVHRGPFDELDRTYGALGRHVAERSLVVGGPVRERYLVSPADTDDPYELRTEVAWPIDENRRNP